MFYKIVSVFIGGGIGAILRFISSEICKKFLLSPVIGTFLVNIAGCFILGLVFGLTLNKFENIPETLKLFITVGFLGGLTTFSTFNLEIFEFFRAGKLTAGFLYLFLSCLFGLLFTFLGYFLSNN